MRTYQALQPTDQVPAPPDTVQTMLLAAGTAQAMDWASSLTQMVRFTGMSTANAQLCFMVNLVSTHAIVPTSGSSVTTGTSVGSTGNSVPVIGTRTFQLPSWSTGWSAAALTSGYVIAEAWHK